MPPLRFERWDLPAGVSLSAVVPGNLDLCGIYVIEFGDGEEYVGQATMGLLRRGKGKGKGKGMMARFHDDNLADEVFLHIAELD